MNHDWQARIDRLKSDDLTEQEIREFEAALLEDPAHVDAYMDALLTETALEIGSLPKLKLRHGEAGEPALQAIEEPEIDKRKPAVAVAGRRRWLPIAACLCLLSVAGFFIGRLSLPEVHAPVFVATVTDADALAEAAGLRIGQPLKAGLLQVPENSAIGLAMRDGARLEIRGPADLTLERGDQVRLARGLVSTYAPTYAQGFTILTPDGKLVDQGTRFVAASGAGLGTEVHVLEGLVDAFSGNSLDRGLKGEDAAILKNGTFQETEYLARRIEVPLDPRLPDEDGDGFPDAVELQFGSDPKDAGSRPEALRVEESFAGYKAGAVNNVMALAKGKARDARWQGGGAFVPEGLHYENGGRKLVTSGGAVETSGRSMDGAFFLPDDSEFPASGVTYISFLMRLPRVALDKPFAGMLLYRGDREELFVGKISVENSFGSRMQMSTIQNGFHVPVDGSVHLFVIRIDRTRLITDIFMDPRLGEPEEAQARRIRYQTVPDFDRIMFRSGAASEGMSAQFDELRSGLSWDAVLPVAR